MWSQHGTSYAARHDTTLRLLARIGRAAFGLDLDGTRHSRLRGLRAGPHSSGRVPALRVPRFLPRRMRRTPPLAGCTTRTRLLLSDHSGRAPKTRYPNGG